MGCTHFIVGRNHTGVENYYGDYESHDLFRNLGNIGIEPVFFQSVCFDNKSGQYEEIENPQNMNQISGTEARQSIIDKKKLPSWFMRESVQDMLFSELELGNSIFQK